MVENTTCAGGHVHGEASCKNVRKLVQEQPEGAAYAYEYGTTRDGGGFSFYLHRYE
jgi:hypothetical protein